jgi:hypothetical protein
VARSIRIDVDGTAATAELHDDVSPVTAEAFWQSLPIEADIWQDGWSGLASTFSPTNSALAGVPEAEAIVCSIYPGTMVLTPRGERAFISYGTAEYRDELGTLYAARVARVREGWPELQAKLASLHDVGMKRIRITRAG